MDGPPAVARAFATMNRLQAEWHRLYLPRDRADAGRDPTLRGLAGPHGEVRALVLELAGAGAWEPLGRVWRGAQADLLLPAPAIAASGRTGLQLWFSLQEPVAAQSAVRFLDGLRARYLADVAPERVRCLPAESHGASVTVDDTLPPARIAEDRWSAFVAPDLAPMFADEPWLDLPPNPDAQAELLSAFASTPADAFARASKALEAAPSAEAPAGRSMTVASGGGLPSVVPRSADPVLLRQGLHPRAFLRSVMEDASIDLRLRIEAAKALLPDAGPE